MFVLNIDQCEEDTKIVFKNKCIILLFFRKFNRKHAYLKISPLGSTEHIKISQKKEFLCSLNTMYTINKINVAVEL